MGRYDALIKCAQIKKLIDENKYKKALEIAETLDFRRNYSISDLYMFADVYIKADLFDNAKQILYRAYEKSHSKRVLKRLILLLLRMDDLKEAQELFLEYEMSSNVTLDTYELRYRLAKAEGVPIKKMIEILESLRKEEFTEEWGFQLAKLYELDSNQEKCIEVCNDIILWFGKGSIVNRAKELIKTCGSTDFSPLKESEFTEPLTPNINEIITDESNTIKPDTIELDANESNDEVQKKYIVDEDNIFYSDNGYAYFTLKDTILQLKNNPDANAFVITGGEEPITMAVAKKILKELRLLGGYKAKNLAKISAEKLNQVNLEERIEKILGGCMLIQNAGDITKETTEQLLEIMDKHDIIIILTGDFEELDCWLRYHPDIENHFYFKIKL